MIRIRKFHIPGVSSGSSSRFSLLFLTLLLFVSSFPFVYADDIASRGVNRTDEMGRTPLMRALWLNRDDLVHKLLQNGADTEVKDKNGQTALYLALQFSENINTVDELLAAGAHVNTLDNRGRSPLEVLITRGRDSRYASLLLERGVTVGEGSHGDSLFFTALDHPVPSERSLYLESLYEAGFSVNATNSSGRTPREEALLRSDISSASLLANFEKRLSEDLIRELDVRGRSLETVRVEELLGRGAQPSFRNFSGYNACHYAVAAGRPDILELLLNRSSEPPFADDPPELQSLILSFPLDYDRETAQALLELLFDQGMNPNSRDEEGYTLLSRGIYHSSDIASFILKRGGDPNRLDPGNMSPLMIAMIADLDHKTSLIKELLKAGVDPSFRDDQGWDLFTYAILYGNSPEIIHTLLDLGIDPDSRDEYGTPGFFWAAAYGNDIDLLKTLIPNSEKASWQDKDGWTPLMGALHFGNSPEVVSYLAGLTPDGRITDGTGTGLREYREYYRDHFFEVPPALDHLIARKRVYPVDDVPYGGQLDEALAELVRWGGKPDVISRLIHAGADTEYKNAAGFNSIIGASAYGDSEQVQTLIHEGASVFSVTEYGWTALHVAAWTSDTETADLLVSEGLDVNVRDFENWTPLMWAARNGSSPEYMKKLLDLGADADVRSYAGVSALHLACSGWTEPKQAVLELLLEGVSVNGINGRGETPYYLAASKGYDKACSFLLERGADPDIMPGLSNERL